MIWLKYIILFLKVLEWDGELKRKFLKKKDLEYVVIYNVRIKENF